MNIPAKSCVFLILYLVNNIRLADIERVKAIVVNNVYPMMLYFPVAKNNKERIKDAEKKTVIQKV